MKELNELFSDIEFQYQDESNKRKKLKICKYSPQRLLFYYYQLDWLLFQYLLF